MTCQVWWKIAVQDLFYKAWQRIMAMEPGPQHFAELRLLRYSALLLHFVYFRLYTVMQFNYYVLHRTLLHCTLLYYTAPCSSHRATPDWTLLHSTAMSNCHALLNATATDAPSPAVRYQCIASDLSHRFGCKSFFQFPCSA